jgi:hypothetical protein
VDGRFGLDISRAAHALPASYDQISLARFSLHSIIFYLIDLTLRLLVPGSLDDAAGCLQLHARSTPSHSLRTNMASQPPHDHKDFGAV